MSIFYRLCSDISNISSRCLPELNQDPQWISYTSILSSWWGSNSVFSGLWVSFFEIWGISFGIFVKDLVNKKNGQRVRKRLIDQNVAETIPFLRYRTHKTKFWSGRKNSKIFTMWIPYLKNRLQTPPWAEPRPPIDWFCASFEPLITS